MTNRCPCGCSRTIRHGCTYGSPQCYNRWKKQQVQNDFSRRICATCDRKLTKVDVARGNARCQFCRDKKPGHVGGARLFQGGKKATMNPASRMTIANGRAKAIKETVTWWMEPQYAGRAAFQAEATRRHPSSVFGVSMPDYQRNPQA